MWTTANSTERDARGACALACMAMLLKTLLILLAAVVTQSVAGKRASRRTSNGTRATRGRTVSLHCINRTRATREKTVSLHGINRTRATRDKTVSLHDINRTRATRDKTVSLHGINETRAMREKIVSRHGINETRATGGKMVSRHGLIGSPAAGGRMVSRHGTNGSPATGGKMVFRHGLNGTHATGYRMASRHSINGAHASATQALHGRDLVRSCEYQLRLQTGSERLAVLMPALNLAIKTVISEPRVCLAIPYTEGGRLYGDGSSSGVPLSTYLQFAGNVSRQMATFANSIAEPRTILFLSFVGTGVFRIDEQTVQGPAFGAGSTGTMAIALGKVIDFLEAEQMETASYMAGPIELRLQQPNWYKLEASRVKYTTNMTFSPPLQRMATFVERTYFRCGHDAPVDSAAVARIAYDAGRRSTAAQLRQLCLSKFMAINSAHEAANPSPRCPSLLATDWFVGADGVMPPLSARAIRLCWENATSEASGPSWLWVDQKLLPRIVACEPLMQRAFELDHRGLHLFLEIALLARAKTCIASSHLGRVIDVFRTSLQKPICMHV
eukprot:4167423-Pleurochrysis_carterae.AAC.1